MSAARIYIGRLTSRVSERDIENFFRGYGRIRDILLKNGFGFVEFEDRRDAEDAVYDLNGKELAGERVILDYSKPRGGGRGGFDGGRGGRSGSYGDRRDGDRGGRFNDRGGPPKRESRYGRPYSTRHRVMVENLSSRISWQDLKDQVRRNGVEPTYAEAHKRPNEALLCFATSDELKKCIEKCDGMELNGRKIKMIDDSQSGRSRSRSRTPRDRRRSRSGSRSSRSKSRSRSPRRRRESKSKSRSNSRSRSRSAGRKSRSGSRSPAKASPKQSPNGTPKLEARDDSGSPRRNRSESPADGDN